MVSTLCNENITLFTYQPVIYLSIIERLFHNNVFVLVPGHTCIVTKSTSLYAIRIIKNPIMKLLSLIDFHTLTFAYRILAFQFPNSQSESRLLNNIKVFWDWLLLHTFNNVQFTSNLSPKPYTVYILNLI